MIGIGRNIPTSMLSETKIHRYTPTKMELKDAVSFLEWQLTTPRETNSSHLKMDGWNTMLSYWEGLFSGVFAVSFREGNGCFPAFLFEGEVT